MNYTVFESGGKQYLARSGDLVRLEKLQQQEGAEVVFDKVLLSVEGDKVVYGSPYIKQQTVRAQVVRHAKAEKIKIIKFKRRKHSLKHQGHRQWFTEVRILAPGEAKKTPTVTAKSDTKKTVASTAPKQASSKKEAADASASSARSAVKKKEPNAPVAKKTAPKSPSAEAKK